jgi:predicted transport protein
VSELRLFTLGGNAIEEAHAQVYILEKEVQVLFESNLETLLGVRFVGSEFVAGPGNRIDTLGLDENNFPVVIEYKLDKNRTVINQGVAYLVWIKNHQAEFWKAVLNKLGKDVADAIDFSSVRLICIAADFTRDDLGMYELMPNMIDLVRYRRFGVGHLLLERITSNVKEPGQPSTLKVGAQKSGTDKTMAQWLADQSPETMTLFESIRKAVLERGDDIAEKETKLSISFRRTRNFASLTYASKGEFCLYLHLDPIEIEIRDGLRDVSKIGHWGTGDLEVRIKILADVQAAVPLIARAYEGGQP